MQQTFPKLSMIFTLSGMFTLALTDNLIVLVSQTSSLWLFQTLRGIIAVGVILSLALIGAVSLRAQRPFWVILRNVFNATALLIYFACLAFLPIGIVAAGFLTAPIFVLVLSILFRGEKAGVWRWGAVTLGFVGALMLVWPEDGNLEWYSALPVLAGLFYAISAIGTRQWCEGESVWVMTFAYIVILGLWGAIGLAVLTIWPVTNVSPENGWVLRGYVPPDQTMMWVTIAQALGSVFGVLFLTKGYQLGEASYVAINEYSMIVFAAFFAWLLWGQTLGTVALVGMGLIILSGSIIAVRSK
ncbi:DMT family transporter [Octadecabacter sp. CECT 8868]|uniref:DMT family transporter n=1 Tax=Octadecabacter algicola TaxID=2909342 RepID=UPI001F2A9877|nr:DMT family transporter [Octadecabacter algicola]MCF2905317.1 DMT family transporter [Octadecabacter algicola]